jgi:hypothetical protein
MANLPLEPVWHDGIYQFEIDDDVIAGVDGLLTLPHRQLGDRTEWLKQQIDAIVPVLDGVNGEVVEPDVAAKLTALYDTKNAIKTAIETKGVTVPEDTPFGSYSGLIADIIGTGVEVWNVFNSDMVNPGTGIGGIRWNDPVAVDFDHIGIFEGGIEVSNVERGFQRFEPPEGIHQYIIKVVFANEQISNGYQLPETTYFYQYDAVLQTVIVAMTAPNRLTLTFDNFINITDTSGISIPGISDTITLVDQPDVRTIRLELAESMFISGVPYMISYDARNGNIELSNGDPYLHHLLLIV